MVWAALDLVTKKRVAVKRIELARKASSRCRQRVRREVAIMKHFNHENLIGLQDMVLQDDSVCLVMDLLDTDLARMINSGTCFTGGQVQLFVYQILRGLKALHSAAVVHRDLKPQNCLINRNCDLKICDFGTGRGLGSPDLSYQEDVTTLWYCAPEGLVQSKSYTSAVDVWSVGCIMAELLHGEPLFRGRDPHEQLSVIIDTLGSGPGEECSVPELRRHLRFASNARCSLADALPKASRDAVDLLAQMLALDPCHRISAEEALRHPYLADLHDPDDEPIALPFDEDLEVVAIDLGRTAPAAITCGHCMTGEELSAELWQESLVGATST